MPSFFGKSGKKPEWLVKDENLREKLYTETFCNVDDPFDPGPLWERRYGGGKKIAESETGKNDLRLRDALDSHRGTVVLPDGEGRLVETLKVFNDVIMYLPAAAWNRDRQMGGGKLQLLADNLASYHFGDFENSLLFPERKPVYAILPHDGLDHDQVAFQFGFGVFVPGANDRPAYRISMKVHEKTPWLPLPDMVVYENGRPVSRPTALYADQQFLLIGPDMEARVVAPPETADRRPVWFSHRKGYIWLNLMNFENEQDDFAFGDGKCVGNGETVLEELAEGNSQVLFRSLFPHDGDSDRKEILMLKIDPEPESDVEAETPSSEPETRGSSYTIVPGMGVLDAASRGRTIVPGTISHQLILSGFALLKEKLLQDQGLLHWTIWFDSKGLPMGGAYEETSDSPAFAGICETGFLYCRAPGDIKYRRIKTLPYSVKDKNGNVYKVVPSPLPEIHHGILMLPQPRFFPVGKEKRTLGSSVPKDQIRLDALSSPQSLKWARGQCNRESALGDVFLSGEHAEAELAGNKLEVKLTKGRAPVYRLGTDLKLLDSRHSPFESGKLEIGQGEFLLIGCYLLCFG